MDPTEVNSLDLNGDMEGESLPEIGEKRDISGDGGVYKEIIKFGSGWEQPEKGDKVTVHYVGTLEADGSEFDSSRGRNEPFTFTLGQGAVIKGWDCGVATMRRGEIAKLYIGSDYGYGDAGSPPKIPGGATLVFEVELLSWKSVKDIAGDGGVIKTIVKEGEGWPTPNEADEVLVEVSAWVQGAAEPFYATPEGGAEFTLGEGHLCTAVKVAAKTMKKGEQVKLVVAPGYGFGAEGGPGGVPPPGAILEIDLTLVGWKKVEQVTPDGGVVKKTLQDTTEWARPNAGATVTVAYVGRLADGSVFDARSEEDPLVFVTEEEQAPCRGFELAIMQMKTGERSLVTLTPEYAFGEAGTAKVPGGATVSYEITLKGMEKAKESWDMNEDEKVAAGGAVKDKGNAAFKAGNIERAIKLWERAKTYVEYDDAFTAENKRLGRALKHSCDLNLAAALLKAKRPVEARKAAEKVLATDGFNMKALYRRAQSFIDTGDWVEAGQDIQKALGQEPENSDFKLLARKLRVAESAAAKSVASMWAGSFAKMARQAKADGKKPAAVAAAEEQGGEKAMQEAAGPSGS